MMDASNIADSALAPNGLLAIGSTTSAMMCGKLLALPLLLPLLPPLPVLLVPALLFALSLLGEGPAADVSGELVAGAFAFGAPSLVPSPEPSLTAINCPGAYKTDRNSSQELVQSSSLKCAIHMNLHSCRCAQ